MFLQIWLPPILLLLAATSIAFPLSRYMTWILEGNYKTPMLLQWLEKRFAIEPQNFIQYATALLIFNTILFIYGYLVLCLQPYLPLNPTEKTLLAPSTIFNTVVSFMTNTDLQHYSGEVHLSNFSQLFFGLANLFTSAAIGLCALLVIIRLLRGEKLVGNFFLDMWRIMIYLFLPIAMVYALFFIWQGVPMTLDSFYQVTTLEKNSQTIAIGPVAAFEAIKLLGTNGGGFFAMNAAHPFENPTALANFFNLLAMMLFPFAIVLMYGRMLNRIKHSYVIFGVMIFVMSISIIWTIYFDTLQPNPAFIAHPAKTYHLPTVVGNYTLSIPTTDALPIDQHQGNLEGKELRFGTSAGATYAAITADITGGSINAELDSMNPIATISPMVGMWINSVFGGVGVGMINMLMYIVLGIFLAGMMVGRSPEYLGKRIGPAEIKLAIIALFMHPFLVLVPSGIFAATHWGQLAISNPGAHGLSQIVYQFTSASANNGSAFNGLKVIYGFWNNISPAPTAVIWDIVTGIIIIFGRFIPIIAAIAMAAHLGANVTRPANLGTLRDDTFTFGCLLFGTIFVLGALLFLPVTALGPLAEHLGPIPFKST